MKSAINNLAALVQLALHKQAFIPVCDTEITNALRALQHACELLPFCNPHPRGAATDLQQATDVLAALIYLAGNGKIACNARSRKNLIHQAVCLHKKITGYVHEYGNATIPYQLLPVKELLKVLSGMNEMLRRNTVITEAYTYIQPHLEELRSTKTMHYHRWLWWSRFAGVDITSLSDAEAFSGILINLNFNTPAFKQWLFAHLLRQEAEIPSLALKGEWLMQQLLKVNMENDGAVGYLAAEKTVQQTMAAFLKTRLVYFARQPFVQQHVPALAPAKINTILSVPQLALFIRLLVETKMINEANQSALLKHIAAVMATSKTGSISPESLRVNYYTPATPAKNIVKEYLLQMLRLINKY